MQTRKFISVLLTLLMMAGVIAVAPITASAATVHEVSSAAELYDVLDRLVDEGDTIKLMDDIDYDDPIEYHNMTIIFDLNGFTLNATGGLYVLDGAELKLANPANGAFNVSLDDYDSGALVVNNGKAEVTNVNSSGDYMVAVDANASEITIYGNVAMSGEGGVGVRSFATSEVTIEGTLTIPSGEVYIQVGSTVGEKTQTDFTTPTTKTGYRTYTNSGSTVWVKMPTYAVTVSGGTANKAQTYAGDTVTVTATVPAGKLFDKWTATGVTLTEAQKASASISFTMPGNAVTVTAAFKDAKGIFGTKARWTGEWWHYVLFFLGFGFIWMWFI